MAKETEAIGAGSGLLSVWQVACQNAARAFWDTQEEFGKACGALVDEGARMQSEGVKIARQSLDAGNIVYESMVKASGENLKRGVDMMTKLWINPCRRQMEEFNKILFGG